MTAAETWPDGRPKSTLNRAWFGEQPLVEPLDVVYGVGDLVALKSPVDQKGDPVVRGVVLDVATDEDGDKVLAIAREVRRDRTGTYTDVRWDFLYEEHPAGDFDPAWHIPSTIFDRTKTWSAAGRIAMAVGYRHRAGSAWTRHDRLLIGGALVLADLDHAAAGRTTPAARDDDTWEENRG